MRIPTRSGWSLQQSKKWKFQRCTIGTRIVWYHNSRKNLFKKPSNFVNVAKNCKKWEKSRKQLHGYVTTNHSQNIKAQRDVLGVLASFSTKKVNKFWNKRFRTWLTLTKAPILQTGNSCTVTLRATTITQRTLKETCSRFLHHLMS